MYKKIKLYMLDLWSVRIVLIFTVLISVISGIVLPEKLDYIVISGITLIILFLFGLLLLIQNMMSKRNKIRYLGFEDDGLVLYYFDKSTKLIPYAGIKSIFINDKYGYTKTLVMRSFALFISINTETNNTEIYSDILASNIEILKLAKEKNLKLNFSSAECKSFFEKRL